jgi:SAM-dependent methyltransferase
VPIILDICFPIKSVVDIGCGSGAWLKVFRDYGIADVVGLDGDYIDRDKLFIPSEQFQPVDLSIPFSIPRKFDLAICLEVAEHLPQERAKDFVKSISSLSTLVIWSAAIPFQGGFNHVNEQYSPFWIDLFNELGYQWIDCFRCRIWDNHQVQVWYRQNMMLFANKVAITQNPQIANEMSNNSLIFPAVHPDLWEMAHDFYRSEYRPIRKWKDSQLNNFIVTNKYRLRNYIRKYL